MQDTFAALALIFIVALAFTAVLRVLKQPLIIAYIVTGIVLGPFVLNVTGTFETVDSLAQMGVVLLLFLVGLNLNPNVIKEVGKASFLTGIGQVVIMALLGFGTAKILGFSNITSVYITLALTFSSTIIVMKLLTDKGDIETLYGRISIGFMIVQDMLVILLLMTLSSLSTEGNWVLQVAFTLVKAAIVMIVLFVVSKSVLPSVTKYIAKSQEFLLLFSLGWCIIFAVLFHLLGFSYEGGALFAGFLLSFSSYRYEIGSKLRPLRDFFLMLFFIVLGSQLIFHNAENYIVPILVFSIFVLFGTPLIVLAILGYLGYTKRTGFFTGLAVAQISEFSFILVALGVNLGHLESEILSLITVIGLITFAGSTYFVMYSEQLYHIASPYLSVFERGKDNKKKMLKQSEKHDVILFGYNRIGYDILRSLKKIKTSCLVVDYNPDTISLLEKKKVSCKYGDASDLELLSEINLKGAKMIISTIRDLHVDQLVIKKAKEANPNVIIIVVSHQIDESLLLYEEGATYVVMPHFLGGHHASTLIEECHFNMQHFLREKANHLKHLKIRKSLGHEHPTNEKVTGA